MLLPSDLAEFSTSEPLECFELVIRTLEEVADPELIEAVGDELLQNLLNDNSAVIHAEVAHHLRTNRRFRQAFSCGNYASVDPALISEWVTIFRNLGTTKKAERKSLRARGANL